MIYLTSFVLFAVFYFGLGILLNQNPNIFSYSGAFRYFALAATLALPALIVSGGWYALLGVALSGLLLGTYGRKIALDLADKQ